MPSRFANLTQQRGGPLLKHALGDRESDGSYGIIFYVLPNQEKKKLTDVIVGPVQLAMVLDDRTGNVHKQETITVRVPRSRTNDLTKALMHKARFTLPMVDDREWVMQSDGSSSGDFWNVYALERKPLANFNENRDAPIR